GRPRRDSLAGRRARAAAICADGQVHLYRLNSPCAELGGSGLHSAAQESLEELRVAVSAAAVLGRASSRAGEALRLRCTCGERNRVLDDDGMSQAVAEVVVVTRRGFPSEATDAADSPFRRARFAEVLLWIRHPVTLAG